MQETILKVNPDFQAWAKSLSGCDGGDPKAQIWISGIEWGYGKTAGQSDSEHEAALIEYYREGLLNEMSEGGIEEPNDIYDWDEHNEYPFGRSVAKLVLAYNGHSVERYWEASKILSNSDLFKFNLYPIAFRNVDDALWDKYGLDAITGLPTKHTYRAWCFANRFPAIGNYVSQYRPKLIVGIGVSYLYDFLVCFAGSNGTSRINVETIKPPDSGSQQARYFYWTQIDHGETTLSILPFFSSPRYGLNSNYLLDKVGSRLQQITSLGDGS